MSEERLVNNSSEGKQIYYALQAGSIGRDPSALPQFAHVTSGEMMIVGHTSPLVLLAGGADRRCYGGVPAIHGRIAGISASWADYCGHGR